MVLQTLIFAMNGMIIFSCPQRLHIGPRFRAQFAHGRGDIRHTGLNVVQQRAVFRLFAHFRREFRRLFCGRLGKLEDRIFGDAGPFRGVDAHVRQGRGEKIRIGAALLRRRVVTRIPEAPILRIAAAQTRRILLTVVGVIVVLIAAVIVLLRLVRAARRSRLRPIRSGRLNANELFSLFFDFDSFYFRRFSQRRRGVGRRIALRGRGLSRPTFALSLRADFVSEKGCSARIVPLL